MAEIRKWKRKKKDSINDKQWLKSAKNQENKRKVIDFSDKWKCTEIPIKQGIYLSREAVICMSNCMLSLFSQSVYNLSFQNNNASLYKNGFQKRIKIDFFFPYSFVNLSL